MIHLFRAWSKWAGRIRRAERVALLLDFDGTLSPIARRPEIPRLSPSRRKVLQDLGRNGRVVVGIISGRALRDLRHRVGIHGLYYAGNHGLELAGPGIRFIHPEAVTARPLLRRIGMELGERLKGVPGILVENKTLSLSLHLRRVHPSHRSQVRRLFARTLKPYLIREEVRVTRGKMVLEVRPAVHWDKGSAVRLIRRELRRSSRTFLCYLGDDETDEAAFRALGERDLAVFVGGRKRGSAAPYYLRDPGEVEDFLKRLRDLTTSVAA